MIATSTRPYAFVSYASADQAQVLPIVAGIAVAVVHIYTAFPVVYFALFMKKTGDCLLAYLKLRNSTRDPSADVMSLHRRDIDPPYRGGLIYIMSKSTFAVKRGQGSSLALTSLLVMPPPAFTGRDH